MDGATATVILEDELKDAHGLTARQREVLVLIVRRLRSTGIPPTIREIGIALSIRTANGVVCHIRALSRKGMILASRDNSARNLIVTDAGYAALGLLSPQRFEEFARLAITADHIAPLQTTDMIKLHFSCASTIDQIS